MKANSKHDVWRFVSKLGKAECWPWVGGTFSGRYGRFSVAGRSECAHRIVYEVANGPIPSGEFVMHKCNNKLCCNPNHLTVGTNSRNMHHASSSGVFKVGVSGIRGIGFDKKRQYWYAHGYLNGKRYMLYQGPHREKALSARKKWEEAHGVIFNLGVQNG